MIYTRALPETKCTKSIKNHIQLLILTTCPIFATYGILRFIRLCFRYKDMVLNDGA